MGGIVISSQMQEVLDAFDEKYKTSVLYGDKVDRKKRLEKILNKIR